MKLAIVVMLALTGPASALELNDSMQMWKRSPVAIRAKVLSDPAVTLLVKENQSGVLACMNDAADTKPPPEKTVIEMIKICAKP